MLEQRPNFAPQALRPPEDLPVEVERFYSGDAAADVAGTSGAGGGLHDETPAEHPSALDRLGSSPLPKTGFPFIGFMSGVYEHVSGIARGETPAEGT